MDRAVEYLERAKGVQPNAPAVRSLEVIILGRTGREAEALALVRRSIGEGIVDFDLLNAGFTLGMRAHDWALAQRAIELRIQQFPDTRLRGYAQLASMYAQEAKDEARALEYYRLTLQAAPPAQRASILAQVPEPYRKRVEAAQTSASSK
jgi:hypothetical protein